MRPNNPNKRLRGRNRSKNPNPLARSYESNGPDVKIRGSAIQVADKYAQLARDAQSSGDRVMAENYFQHAEHYYRIVAQAYEQSNTQPRERRDDDRGGRDEHRGNGVANGHDTAEEDDDTNRRVAANGNGHDRAADEVEVEDTPDQGVVQDAPVEPTRARTRRNGKIADSEADSTQTARTDEAVEADAATEEAPKPKRRTRTTRARKPRAEAAAEPNGLGEQPPVDPAG